MAKKRPTIQNTSDIKSASFQKGMVKDMSESMMAEGAYLNAINAVNNSKAGDLGIIGNEQSNYLCASAPYVIIGTIHITGDEWAIFSTNETDSEIGIFDESACSYRTVVNDQCLNFSAKNLIIGVARSVFDCTYQVYWADGLNPDRTMNLENPPFIQDCTTLPNGDCIECVDTDVLDCEKLRIARLTTPPCVEIEQGANGGEILNGTYQAVIAYTENEQRVSDYSLPSVPVSLFDHRNVNGSLEVIIKDIDTDYEEFELVIIGVVNAKTVARRIGFYSTRQNRISIDRIDPAANETVPLALIPVDTPAYEKSEAIYRNGDYLIRTAPTTRFSFNYQPLANQIETEWVGVEYPKNYYRGAKVPGTEKKGGQNVGYLRDERYPFFIRWVYNTNDKTESYHIPGRAPFPGETDSTPSTLYGSEPYFDVVNTATSLPASGTTEDGGIIVARGKMGYWESSEKYPDDKPEIWGNLCGKNIRHHKMPDNSVINHYNPANGNIIVLGVQFTGIRYPVDNNGNNIPGIIGYEILRGSREGNKTVVAKGLINNMGSYTRTDNGQPAYYQNYPFNDLREDPFLSSEWITGDNSNSGSALGGDLYSRNKFTFHSPDTNFKHPFLSQQELKIYNNAYGPVTTKFVESYEHPKHKIISDFSAIVSALVGFGIGTLALTGEKKRTRHYPNLSPVIPSPLLDPITSGLLATATTGYITAAPALTAQRIAEDTTGYKQIIAALTGITNDEEPVSATLNVALETLRAIPGIDGSTTVDEYSPNGNSGLPPWLRIAQAIPTFVTYWGEGTAQTLETIKAISKYRQYAFAAQSHAEYNNYTNQNAGLRTLITDSGYVQDGLTELPDSLNNDIITVNNLFRNTTVGIIVNTDLPNPTVQDNSRLTAGEAFGNIRDFKRDNIGVEVNSYDNGTAINSSAYYVGLKSRLVNQYGQIDGIIQVPTSCMQPWEVDPENPIGATSDIIFGGDTYIGRYTEKTSFFYFSDWMYNLPDGFEYDYKLRKMMPYPTYWMNTEEYDLNTFFQGLVGMLTSVGSNTDLDTLPNEVIPSDFHNFDRLNNSNQSNNAINFNLRFTVKNGIMYLFNSGVRDFYVESEINIEYRDWEDEFESRHYDPYGFKDLSEMFRTDRIKSPNLYKYDYSLSVSRLYQNLSTWGTTQRRNYDPEVAETCYSYYPKRALYSLPQSKEDIFDNWRKFLVDNKKDFSGRITAIKPVSKSGAMMLFDNQAPVMFQGTESLETASGTSIIIGTGTLFDSATQNLVNVERPYEYGSCQNRMSVINTPAGLFWVSREQGKIFQYGDGLKDISQDGMKWWFEEFLPYKILEDFPDFELLDNPVAGVGVHCIYNNSNSILYVAKKDYRLKREYRGEVVYLGGRRFSLGKRGRFALGDPRYFDDASWTASYDPKSEAWVSFHDWHPGLMLPGKNDHMTILGDGIWKHNDRTDSYCNFYGVDYPFEIDMVTPTGQNVNTLKSIEYLMEVYQWDQEEVDRHHVLDFNFDRAIVYNTEQVSGELRLNLTPKNNAPLLNTYPRVNTNDIDILYSKEEQKYRFNQFWDITDDRGEFTGNVRQMWVTSPNGYIRTLNPNYLNYAKPLHERKKFRHYQSNLRLRRMVSGPNNMQLKLVNSKNQYSMR